jgi:two-component system, NarL family, nitrate/nitrite response regulator NarL
MAHQARHLRLDEDGGPTRVLVVEDQALFAETLSLALRAAGHQAHTVSAATGVGTSAALRATLAVRPHVVLLDVSPDHDDDQLLVQELTRAGCAVVVVTADAERGRWGGFLHHGARGVLATSRPLSELVRAVDEVAAGRPLLAEAEYHALIREWRSRVTTHEEQRRRLTRLTPREQEILHELMQGRSIRDIAEQAVVAEGTVRKQVCAVLHKLGVSTQIAAVGLAHRAGWQLPDALAHG